MATTKIFAGAGSGEGKTQGLYRGGLFFRNPGEGEWQAVTNGLPQKVEVRTIAVHPKDRDRKSTRLNSSHMSESRMPSSA